jgi:hypothetical protein
MAFRVNIGKAATVSPSMLGHGSAGSPGGAGGTFPATMPNMPSTAAGRSSQQRTIMMGGDSGGLDSSGGLRAPDLDSGMLFHDIGTTGLRQWGGWVREEFLPQLAGRQAARAYREMMDNSSVIGSIIFAIQAAMRKIEWRTEPADDTPAAAELADFFEGARHDMSHTWSDFVNEQLSMLGYGFAPHEIVYKFRNGTNPGKDARGEELPKSDFDDGMIGWRRIPLRGQDTVIKWFFGGAGQIRGMTQQPWIGPLVDIPVEKLLIFRPSSHKGNPEGRSILRSAYRSWWYVKRLEEMEAILFERLSGIPVIKIPGILLDKAAAGDPVSLATVAQYKRIATNVRIDEQMGVLIPSDRFPGPNGPTAEAQYSFELVAPNAGRSNADSDKMIGRYNVNMMTSVLADFLQLGHESRGTQSLAVSKIDLFFQAMEGFLNSNADVLNRHGVPRLGDLNGFDRDLLPKYVPDMPQRVDLDVLSNFVLRLAQAGMPLFPNDTLQEYLTDAAGMPDISEDGASDLTGLDQPQPEISPAKAERQRQMLEKILSGAIAKRFNRMNGAVGHTGHRHATRKARLRPRRSVEAA